MANQITYKLGFQVDNKGITEVRNSLKTLQNLNLNDIAGPNQLNLKDAEQHFSAIIAYSNKLEHLLDRSFNKTLGTLNVSKFNEELKNIDINDLYKEFSYAGVAGQNAFRNITAQALTTNTQMKQTHKILDDMAVTMKNTIKWSISSSLMNSFTGSIERAYGYIKNLDTSLNDIRIVTGKSADEMANFAVQANKAAQALGSRTTDYTNAALIYAQQGLGDEEIEARTEVTLKAANVTQQSTAEVSEQLTAVWNGYKVSADEAELYVDKLAATAATTASDLEELSTGMSRVASAASLMGVDVDQLNAQLSTIISVTRQAPESVGTALKSIYARISDIEAGLDAETTLGNYTKEMAQYGINVLDANNKLRDMGEVIEEVGGKWATLTREQQTGLSQAMAGTRQYVNLLALFNNWDNYTKALETSRNAVGTLQEQQDIYMESTKAHLRELSAAQEELFGSLLDADTINLFADGMTKVTKTLTTFVNVAGGGKGVLLALGTIGTQVFSSQISQGIAKSIMNLKAMRDNTKQVEAELEIMQKLQSLRPNQDDDLTTQLINRKKIISELSSVITEEQNQEANALINQINNLENASLEWENLKKQVVDFYNAYKGRTDPDIVDIEGIEKNSVEYNAITNVVKNAGQEYLKKGKILEKYTKQLETVEAAEKRVQEVENAKKKNTGEITEAYKKLDQEYEKMAKLMAEIAEESSKLSQNNLSSEQLKAILSAYEDKYEERKQSVNRKKGKKRQKGQQRDIFASPEMRDLSTQFAEQYKKDVDDVVAGTKKAGETIRSEAEGASNKFRNSTEEAEAAWEAFVEKLTLAKQVQALVGIVSAIGRITSAAVSLYNVVNVINDETLSDGEKIVQIITTISFSLPMVLTGLKDLSKKVIELSIYLELVTAEEIKAGNAAVIMGKKFMAAIGAYLPLILAASAAVAGIAIAIYKVNEAAHAHEKALRQASEQVESLTNRYSECQQAAESLKTTISDYRSAVDALSDLNVETEEYAEALEAANEKARELIETHGLYKDYQMNGDLISFAPGSLDNALSEAQQEQARVRSNLYNAKVSQNQADIDSQLVSLANKLGVGIFDNNGREDYREFRQEEIIKLANNLSQLDKIVGNNVEALKEEIETSAEYDSWMGVNIEAIISNREALLNFADSLRKAAESTDYYNEQAIQARIEERYGDQLSLIAGDNKGLYSLLVSSIAEIASQRNPIEQTELDKKTYSSIAALNKNYHYDIENAKDLALTYAKKVLQVSDRNLIYKKGAVLDASGKEVVGSGVSKDFMLKSLAELSQQRKAIDEVVSSINSIDVDTLDKLAKGAKEAGEKYGVDFTNALLASIVNNDQTIDFSSIFKKLRIEDRDSLSAMNQDELMNFLGIKEEDLISLSRFNAETFHKAWVDALREYNIADAIAQSRSNAETAQSALDTLSKDKKTKAEIQELEESLVQLGVQYEELGAIQDKTSHEYLATLRKIKEEEEGRTLKGLEEQRTAALKEYQSQIEKLNRRQQLGIDGEAFEKELEKAKEALQKFVEADREVKLYVDVDLRTDVKDAFGLADEIDNLREIIRDDLYYSLDDTLELIEQGFGEMFVNADVVAKQIGDSATATAETMIAVDRDVLNAFIDNRQAELEADRQAKIAQLENQIVLLDAQKAALMQKKEAVQKALAAENEMDVAAAMQEIANADAVYQAKVEELNQIIKDEQTAAEETQSINETLYNSLSHMYDQDSLNLQNAENAATDVQAREIQKRIANVELLSNAYSNLAKQVLASEEGVSLGLSFATNVASGGGNVDTGRKDVKTASFSSSLLTPAEIQAKAIDLFKNNHQQYIATLEATGKAIDNEIDAIDRKRGEAYAGIAALKSANLNLDKAQAGAGRGKGGGGGSGSQKDPELLDYLEDETDRYHDVNLELEALQTNLDRLSKQQDKLYGQELVVSLNEQLKVLEKQKETNQKKLEIAKEERAEMQAMLALQGVSFDSEGYIANYTEAMQAKLAVVNSLIDQYNAMSAEEQENAKDALEEAKEDYENFVSQIQRYDELVSSFIPDIEDEIQDRVNKEIEISIKKFTMEIDLRLEMGEAEREFNEFRRKVLDEIKDDDIIGNAESKVRDYLSYFDTYGTGIGSIQKLTDQVNSTMEEIDKIDSEMVNLRMDADAQLISAYGDNKAQAMEDLKKYYEELMDQLEDIVDLVDEIRHSYLDMIDEAVEAFDKQVDQYDYIADLLKHDMNVVGLVYGDRAYDEMARYYEQIEKNNNQELDFLRKRVDYAREMMDQETNPEAREKWEEEWMNSLEKLNEKVEDSIQNIIDKYSNAVNKTFEDLNKKVTGGFGLDYVDDEWDLINKNADRYLDTINSLYAVQDLESKYQDAIDNSTSLSTQQKLNDMMNEQLGMLRDKEKLTQYDVDRANMLYEIALKQIALEDAQQNKSKMRLRRDSQGNYSYQFVSDEEAVGDAEDDLLAAKNDLYNFDKENYKKNLDDIYNYYVEFQEKYKEIMLDMSLTDEERQQRTLMLQQQYGELINGLVASNEDIRKNLYESAFDALEGLYAKDADSFKEMTGQEIDAFRDLTDTMKDLVLSDLIPQWDSNVQHMADVFAGEGGFIPTCKDAFIELDETTKDYKDSLDDLAYSAGIDFDMIGEGYDETIDRAQQLLEKNDELIQKYDDQIQAILKVIEELDRLIDKYEDAYEAAKQATRAAYEYQQTQREIAADSDMDLEDDIGASGPNTSYTPPSAPSLPSGGGSSGGSGSGGSGGSSHGGSGSSSGAQETKKKPKYYILLSTGANRVYRSMVNGQMRNPTSPGDIRSMTAKGSGIKTSSKRDEEGETYYEWLMGSGSNKFYSYYRPNGLTWVPQYRTGGYTGDWGDDSGRLAMLHRKELILNSSDTENMLAAVNIVRDIASVMDNINNNLLGRLMGLSSSFNAPMSAISAGSDSLEQKVYIEASFPNVQSSHEIEDALNNLVNVASQRAFRSQR